MFCTKKAPTCDTNVKKAAIFTINNEHIQVIIKRCCQTFVQSPVLLSIMDDQQASVTNDQFTLL